MSELKKREEIKEEFKWKVEKIYTNIEAWEKDFEDLKNEAVKLKDYSGKLTSGEMILEYLQVNEKISRKAENLYVYAHLKSDEDTSNPTYQSLMSKIDIYMAEFASYTAFFVPEMLSLEDKFIEAEMHRLEELKKFEFLIKDILKEKPHILSKEMEELLAAASDCLDAPAAIHNILTNADMTFGKIKDEEGKEVELTEGNYSSFIKSKNKVVRKDAFQKLFGEYDKLKNTLATSLTASIKTFNFNSRVRKYNNALEASLNPNNIPVDVYKNAVKVINDNLASLHRYVKIKKKLLGLDEIHIYDLYVPVIELPKEKIELMYMKIRGKKVELIHGEHMTQCLMYS
jgi:oligoendopeptidase F